MTGTYATTVNKPWRGVGDHLAETGAFATAFVAGWVVAASGSGGGRRYGRDFVIMLMAWTLATIVELGAFGLLRVADFSVLGAISGGVAMLLIQFGLLSRLDRSSQDRF